MEVYSGDDAQTKQERRSAIESEHNALRDARERTYRRALTALEEEFQMDLRGLRQDKENAMLDEGLNPDGSDPQGRQQGSVL